MIKKRKKSSKIADKIASKLLKKLAYPFSFNPSSMEKRVSKETQKLIHKVLEGIPKTKALDYHGHIAGSDTKTHGNFIHPNLLSWKYPVKRAFSVMYESAFGINNFEKADKQAKTRLISLMESMPTQGKICLLAFDLFYYKNGLSNSFLSDFYVPNRYVFQLAEEYPEWFIPVMSIHPYREDALDKLDEWSEKGGKMVKWLPNTMGMDPSDTQCIPFYQKMHDKNLILLCHTGDENAIDAHLFQHLGNPMLLRGALDQGVKTIAAHCGGTGSNLHLDTKKEMSNFDLFMELMEKECYRSLLFADLSATPQFNRMQILSTLIQQSQKGGILEGRLINGSDYPMPALNFLFRTKKLQKKGFITKKERRVLNEIYQFHPLFFDFALKRTLKDPVTKQSFPKEIFLENPHLKLVQ